MFVKLSTIFEYLEATPSSRCFVAGESLLQAGHVIGCGVTRKTEEGQWHLNAHCMQTSALKQDPHEINGTLDCGNPLDVKITKFHCSCKAGNSGCCKHIAATLLLCARLYEKGFLMASSFRLLLFRCVLFCFRKQLDDLDVLSCTDLQCAWKLKKPKVEDTYLPKPLKQSKCFSSRSKVKPLINWSAQAKKKAFERALAICPESSLSLHVKGRRPATVNAEVHHVCMNSVPEHVNKIIKKSEESSFISNLEICAEASRDCCKKVLASLKEVSVVDGLCTEQGSMEWKFLRRSRISGSTCYGVYTFKKPDWQRMLHNFFMERSVSTKEIRHGNEQEGFAIKEFQNNNPNYDIKSVGIFISNVYPWLAYSPDGIVFIDGEPSRLLEVKCPYLGRDKPGEEVIPTLKYLDKNLNLKTRHTYYAQVQLGMALLNLPVCDFIIYFSNEKMYFQLIVPFDQEYAKELIQTITEKYFNNMIHFQCVEDSKV